MLGAQNEIQTSISSILRNSIVSLCISLQLGGFAAAADVATKVATPPPIKELPFFLVNDNFLTYSHSFHAAEVVVGPTEKDIVAFTHFDAWAYGTNFFDVQVIKSDKRDPALPCLLPNQGCDGKTKAFGLFRSTLGFNQIFDTKAFTMGPLRNVSFEFGAEASTQNDVAASAKRAYVLGLQFAFDLPYKGYFNVAPLYYKEWNYSRFVLLPPTNSLDGLVEFDGTWAVETNYYIPLGFLPDYLPISFSGYNNFFGPKGGGAPLQRDTKIEFRNEERLTLDVSKLLWNKSHFLDYWVAHRIVKNKYGLDPQFTKYTDESAVVTGVTMKF